MAEGQRGACVWGRMVLMVGRHVHSPCLPLTVLRNAAAAWGALQKKGTQMMCRRYCVRGGVGVLAAGLACSFPGIWPTVSLIISP